MKNVKNRHLENLPRYGTSRISSTACAQCWMRDTAVNSLPWQVDSAWVAGDRVGARQNSSRAKAWSLGGIAFGVAFYVVVVVLVVALRVAVLSED